MSKTDDAFIIHDLASSFSGDRSSKMYVVVNTADNDTEVVLDMTLSKRYKIQDIAEARRVYEMLNGSGLWLNFEMLVSIKSVGQYPAPKKKSKS